MADILVIEEAGNRNITGFPYGPEHLIVNGRAKAACAPWGAARRRLGGRGIIRLRLRRAGASGDQRRVGRVGRVKRVPRVRRVPPVFRIHRAWNPF